MTNYNGNYNTIGQLQSALRSMEDRCQKLQRRTDTLQAENERLLAGRAELLAEVERLQEQQIRLRERNLRLTQEFHAKQQECSLLAEKLTMFARGRVHSGKRTSGKNTLVELNEDGEGSFDSLDRFPDNVGRAITTVRQEPILSKSQRTLSEPNLSVIQRELDQVRKGLWTDNVIQEDSVEKISSELLTNLKKEQTELEEQFTRIVQVQQNSLEVGKDLKNDSFTENELPEEDEDPELRLTLCAQSTKSATEKLQNQQTLLKKFHEILSERSRRRPALEMGTSVVTQTSLRNSESSWSNSEMYRTCPLCESNFPCTVSQETFEDHVMEHFSNEDCVLPDFEILA